MALGGSRCPQPVRDSAPMTGCMWNHVLRNRELLRSVTSRTRPATADMPDVRVVRRVRRDRDAARLVALSRRHLLGSN